MSFLSRKLFFFSGIIDLVALDQVSKYLARTEIKSNYAITDWFQFSLHFNEGIAFSLPAPSWIILGLTVGIAAWLIHESWQQKFRGFSSVGATFILGGALGNGIDRIWHGAVTDFLAFWDFPVFNLADTWITIGVILFLWGELKKQQTIAEQK